MHPTLSAHPSFPDSLSDSSLLQLAQGDYSSAVWAELERRFDPFLRKQAYRIRPGMDEDLYDDIVQETWLGLIKKGPRGFDRARGTPRAYLSLLLRNAARAAMAGYQPPGAPRRPLQAADYRSTQVQYDSITDRVVEGEDAGIEAEATGRHDPTDRLALSIDLAVHLERADAELRAAVNVMLHNDGNMSLTAQETGIPRSTLRRRLREALAPLDV